MSSTFITPTEKITELENGLSIVRYEGNYGFEGFLEQGGADPDVGAVDRGIMTCFAAGDKTFPIQRRCINESSLLRLPRSFHRYDRVP